VGNGRIFWRFGKSRLVEYDGLAGIAQE